MKRTSIALLIAGLLVVAGVRTVAADQEHGPATRPYVVKAGDSLWSIARRLEPSGDNRRTVAELIELNGLRTSTVVPGQPLRLPAP